MQYFSIMIDSLLVSYMHLTILKVFEIYARNPW